MLLVFRQDFVLSSKSAPYSSHQYKLCLSALLRAKSPCNTDWLPPKQFNRVFSADSEELRSIPVYLKASYHSSATHLLTSLSLRDPGDIIIQRQHVLITLNPVSLSITCRLDPDVVCVCQRVETPTV